MGSRRWNLWVWLVGVVVRSYIDFLILLIPTPLVSVLFYSSIPTFCSFIYIYIIEASLNEPHLVETMISLSVSIYILKNEQEVGMLLQKRTDTRGVGISNNIEEILYLFTTTPTNCTHRFHPHPPPANHTHRFHPLPLDTPIHSSHSPQLSSILLTCTKLKVWMTIVESGWNVWVWLVGVGGIYGCG